MRLHRSFAGAAALALFATAALALPPAGGPPRVRLACAADFQKFCPEATPGKGGGQGRCLKQHAAELSDACTAAVQERMAARQERQQQGSPPPGGAAPNP